MTYLCPSPRVSGKMVSFPNHKKCWCFGDNARYNPTFIAIVMVTKVMEYRSDIRVSAFGDNDDGFRVVFCADSITVHHRFAVHHGVIAHHGFKRSPTLCHSPSPFHPWFCCSPMCQPLRPTESSNEAASTSTIIVPFTIALHSPLLLRR